jgi:uncharacterized protein DUF1203
MTPAFRLTPLPLAPFAKLFGLDDAALAPHYARRVTADESPGFPCRVSLKEAEVGETLLLLPFAHHDVASPYAGFGPIYVRENAQPARLEAGEIPGVVRSRLLSVRGYDTAGMMLYGDVVEGRRVEDTITRQFADPQVAYIHLHNAKRGCYSCRVERL